MADADAQPNRSASPDRDRVGWDRRRTFALIDEFRRRRLLWDAADADYHSKNKKAEAWRAVAAAVHCPLDEARRKMNSLMAGYRRELHKARQRGEYGSDYESSWFAYPRMAFLLERKGRSVGDKQATCHFLDDSEVDNDLSAKIEFADTEDYTISIENFDNNISATTSTCNEKEQNGQDIFSEDCLSSSYQEKATTPKRKSSALEDPLSRDHCDIFGEFIASKLRSYDNRTRCIVEFEISKILFNADMGKYDNILPDPQISPHNINTS